MINMIEMPVSHETMKGESLHKFPTSLTMWERLLTRRSGDGSLIPSDIRSIDAAIVQGRSEIAAAKRKLEKLNSETADRTLDDIKRLVAAFEQLEEFLEILNSLVDMLKAK